MRPLFPESWRNETQIVSLVLSADSANDPDVIAVTSASAAAYCSDLPFEKPIACVRVGLVDGQLLINPTVADQKKSLMNIIIAGTDEAIVMVESGALEVSEEAVAEDRKSTRLNSSHGYISYAVFCLKKKNNTNTTHILVAPHLAQQPQPTDVQDPLPYHHRSELFEQYHHVCASWLAHPPNSLEIIPA